LTSANSISNASFRADPGEFDELFINPELFLHMKDQAAIDLESGWKLLDRANATSLDHKWRATIVTDYIMNNAPSDET